jgi:hypothetical protein
MADTEIDTRRLNDSIMTLVDTLNRTQGAFASGAITGAGDPYMGDPAYAARRGSFNSAALNDILAKEVRSVTERMLVPVFGQSIKDGSATSKIISNAAGLMTASGALGNGNIISGMQSLQNGVSAGGLRMQGMGGSAFTVAGPGMATDLLSRKIMEQVLTQTGPAGFGTFMTSGQNREVSSQVASYMMGQGAFRGAKVDFDPNSGDVRLSEKLKTNIDGAVQSGTKMVSSLKAVLGDIGVTNLINEAEALTGLRMNSERNALKMSGMINEMRASAAAAGMTAESFFMARKALMGSGAEEAVRATGREGAKIAYYGSGAVIAAGIESGAIGMAAAMNSGQGFQIGSEKAVKQLTEASERRFSNDFLYQDLILAADEAEKAGKPERAAEIRKRAAQHNAAIATGDPAARSRAEQATVAFLKQDFGADYQGGSNSRYLLRTNPEFLSQVLAGQQELVGQATKAYIGEGRNNPANQAAAARFIAGRAGVFRPGTTTADVAKHLTSLYGFTANVEDQVKVMDALRSGKSNAEVFEMFGGAQAFGTTDAERAKQMAGLRAAAGAFSGDPANVKGALLSASSKRNLGVSGSREQLAQDQEAVAAMLKLSAMPGDLSPLEAFTRGISGNQVVGAGQVAAYLGQVDDGLNAKFRKNKDGGIEFDSDPEYRDFMGVVAGNMGNEETAALIKAKGGSAKFREYLKTAEGAKYALGMAQKGVHLTAAEDADGTKFSITGKEGLGKVRDQADAATRAAMDKAAKEAEEARNKDKGDEAKNAVKANIDAQKMNAQDVTVTKMEVKLAQLNIGPLSMKFGNYG